MSSPYLARVNHFIYFFRETGFDFIDFSLINFLFSSFTDLHSTLIFIISSLLLTLDLIFFFSSFLLWKLKLLILDLSSFLTHALHPKNFDKLYFHLVQNIFKFILKFLLWPMPYNYNYGLKFLMSICLFKKQKKKQK